MWGQLAGFIATTGLFVGADRLLARKTNLKGLYYLIHFVHNAFMVALTLPDVVNSLSDFHNLEMYPQNETAAILCISLHVYHTIVYWQKFRVDDWLHHFLMIGLAIPMGLSLGRTPLLGYSLFFTTGFSGGIDYLMLFLNRNDYITKRVEKEVNVRLNVWFRSPGSVSHATLVVAYALSRRPFLDMCTLGYCLFTALLTYWNGQYFMQQVVWDLAQRSSLKMD